MLKLNDNGDLERGLGPRLGVHSVPYLGVIATAAELRAAGLVRGEVGISVEDARLIANYILREGGLRNSDFNEAARIAHRLRNALKENEHD